MVFSSMIFIWLFLPLTVVCCLVLRKLPAQNILLLIVSLLFYAWGNPVHLPLLIVSIALNYACGMLMVRARASDEADGSRTRERRVLAGGIVINLGLLTWFKYAGFILRTIGRILPVPVPQLAIALPIGISFFTFQSLSYLIDLYRRQIRVQKNPLDLALYVSFFPQLIAGPIVKYHDIEEALTDRAMTMEGFAEGFRRFLYGFGKKVVIANQLALVVDRVYAAQGLPATGEAWLAAICYMLQIYYDFSGYSDMAIGLGRIFGFRFQENFDLPYLSASIREFWRRWHISLSTWFRDYLYIPLGGSRGSAGKTYRNLLIVFALTGLWHGASFSFVFWGLFHGCFLLLERRGFSSFLDRHAVFARVYTLLVVLTGWVFFRAETFRQAWSILYCMFVPHAANAYLPELMPHLTRVILVLAVIGAGPLQCLLGRLRGADGHLRGKDTVWEGLYLVCVLCAGILMLITNAYNPFIYYRF